MEMDSRENTLRLLPVGEAALLVEFGRSIDDQVNERVQMLAGKLGQRGYPWLVDLTPAFASLLVFYDPLLIEYGGLCELLRREVAETGMTSGGSRRVVELPVCYQGEFAPDRADMERIAGMSWGEIIKIHSGRDYKIYMLGFLPGFAYLGGLDERIAAPRLKSPRVRIEPGSVGIGGAQTGIYPLASPGGWRLIGRTPVRLYDPERSEPVFYQAGDYIRFVPITEGEYDVLAADVAAGRWQPKFLEIKSEIKSEIKTGINNARTGMSSEGVDA